MYSLLFTSLNPVHAVQACIPVLYTKKGTRHTVDGCLIQIMKNVTLRQVALNEIMIEIIAHMERIDTKSVSLRELMQSVV